MGFINLIVEVASSFQTPIIHHSLIKQKKIFRKSILDKYISIYKKNNLNVILNFILNFVL